MMRVSVNIPNGRDRRLYLLDKAINLDESPIILLIKLRRLDIVEIVDQSSHSIEGKSEKN